MLSSNINNEGANEPVSYKEAMVRHNWPEWRVAIKWEYNSPIKNGI